MTVRAAHQVTKIDRSHKPPIIYTKVTNIVRASKMPKVAEKLPCTIRDMPNPSTAREPKNARKNAQKSCKSF